MCNYTFLKQQFLINFFFPGDSCWALYCLVHVGRTAWRTQPDGVSVVGSAREPYRAGVNEACEQCCVFSGTGVVASARGGNFPGVYLQTVQWNESCKPFTIYCKIFTSFIIWNSHFSLFIKYFQTRCSDLKSLFSLKSSCSLSLHCQIFKSWKSPWKPVRYRLRRTVTLERRKRACNHSAP